MRITLKQIAKEAQLSVSTTSRALNGHPAISHETTARVRKIAGELRYLPVRSHRRAAMAPTSVLAGRDIAILSMGLDRSLVTMPVISETFHSTEESLIEAGARVHVFHMPNFTQLPKELVPSRLDGLILTGAMVRQFATAADTLAVKQLQRLPSVWLIGDPPGAWGDSVLVDDFAIGAGAAEQLAAYGHRHVAFLNSVPDNLLFARREDGFYCAGRRLGLHVQSFLGAPTGGWPLPLRAPAFGFDAVEVLIARLLESRPLPTAVFTAADSVAALAYCALGVRGLRVGRDISVIAANNTPGLMAAPYPHLATFDIHVRKIAALAVRQLAIQISESARTKNVPTQGQHVRCQLIVKPTFIPGDSICAVANAD